MIYYLYWYKDYDIQANRMFFNEIDYVTFGFFFLNINFIEKYFLVELISGTFLNFITNFQLNFQKVMSIDLVTFWQ